MVLAAGGGRIAKDVFERVRCGTHVEVRAHEAGSVLVVVLDAVPRHVLAADDAAPVLLIPREGETGHPVALGPNQHVSVVEAEDDVVHPEVVHHVDDRARPAHEEDGVVLLDEVRLHQIRREMETRLRAEVDELGLPVRTLPFLPDGIDLSGLYALAEALS